jgi:S-adenosylmethionine:tRNA ribosyltransferase-isomerase
MFDVGFWILRPSSRLFQPIYAYLRPPLPPGATYHAANPDGELTLNHQIKPLTNQKPTNADQKMKSPSSALNSPSHLGFGASLELECWVLDVSTLPSYSKVIHNPFLARNPMKSPFLPSLLESFNVNDETAPVRTADFQFPLPPELIAQHPAARRDESRLMVLHRNENRLEHKRFPDFPNFLRPGDVLVLNDSRVIPARLRGVNAKTGGKFEILLVDENAANDWWTMLRPGKNARPGTEILIQKPNASNEKTSISAVVQEKNSEGHYRLQFTGHSDIKNILDEIGEVPLPPYIERKDSGLLPDDKERYQTVFAKSNGSVAAPTAGLHFTDALLDKIRQAGVKICFVTLHVGPGTFLPVKADNLSEHEMHEERFVLGAETVRAVNDAKNSGARVIAAGTTTVRVLETVAAQNAGKLNIHAGSTNIFIFPPRRFQIVDALLTNFHLPCSTLLMLISAFAAPGEVRGREIILSAYAEAVRERYRFFSYGDAMLIL